MKKNIITGGAGFIGSNLTKYLISHLKESVCVIDKLTYAGHIENLEGVLNNPLFSFKEVDVLETTRLLQIFKKYKPEVIYHLAAESHVDKSIDSPSDFITTNVVGTQSVLHASLLYWQELEERFRDKFRLILVSTDEVYGSIASPKLFSEESKLSPSSPYSASKASADLIAQSYHHTYNLPVIITNCSNNYGSNQTPEKFIPLCIFKAINNESIPIYGDGQQIRDWIHVNDHNRALVQISQAGNIGEVYCIGAANEQSNLSIANKICSILDTISNKNKYDSYEKYIVHVPDRPGHDARYAVDATKTMSLGWQPEISFDEGLQQTVLWYLSNKTWLNAILMKSKDILSRQGKLRKL